MIGILAQSDVHAEQNCDERADQRSPIHQPAGKNGQRHVQKILEDLQSIETLRLFVRHAVSALFHVAIRTFQTILWSESSAALADLVARYAVVASLNILTQFAGRANVRILFAFVHIVTQLVLVLSVPGRTTFVAAPLAELKTPIAASLCR